MQQTVAPSPALIFETFQGHQRTAALRTAVDLELFTAIAEGAATTAAIASRCRASERGVVTRPVGLQEMPLFGRGRDQQLELACDELRDAGDIVA